MMRPNVTDIGPDKPMSSLVYGVIQLVALLCGAVQLHLDAGYDNLLSVACVVLATLVCVSYLRRSGCMNDAPV
ncbi:MAG: hypothetical protein HYX44_07610, partial [Aquabacterium sp.]|nr:hypothetical protein [Aquabacterium sp.]